MIELMLQAERALMVGMVDQAERLYQMAARNDPRNAIAVVGLARVALERNDDRGAYDLSRQALAIDPENAAALRLEARLSEVLTYRGETVERPASVRGTPGAERARGSADAEPFPPAPRLRGANGREGAMAAALGLDAARDRADLRQRQAAAAGAGAGQVQPASEPHRTSTSADIPARPAATDDEPKPIRIWPRPTEAGAPSSARPPMATPMTAPRTVDLAAQTSPGISASGRSGQPQEAGRSGASTLTGAFHPAVMPVATAVGEGSEARPSQPPTGADADRQAAPARILAGGVPDTAAATGLWETRSATSMGARPGPMNRPGVTADPPLGSAPGTALDASSAPASPPAPPQRRPSFLRRLFGR